MQIAQHLANYTPIDNRLIGTIKIVDLVNYDIVIPEIQRIIDSDKTKIIVETASLLELRKPKPGGLIKTFLSN